MELRMIRRSPAMLLLTAALMVGCKVGPDYKAPQINLDDQWGENGREPTTQISTTNPSKISSRPVPLVEWWTTFHDPQLDDLIQKAVAQNLNVQQAELRIREARSQRNIAQSGLWPTVTNNDAYAHARLSKNSPFSSGGSSSSSGSSSGGGASGGSSGGGGGSPSEFNLYQLGFDAIWELDVFGGQRRQIESAEASLNAATEDKRDVLLTLLGDVARNYIELRSYQLRLDIARKNLATQEKTLDITRQQNERGITNELDLNRITAQVNSTQSQIPPLESSVANSIHQLGILLNQRPTSLAETLSPTQKLPPVPEDVPIGLPSELLRRRPDIRRAERQLASATANIGVAVSDLYPKFSLTGAAGLQSGQLHNLPEWNSRYFLLYPSMSWTIFDAGSIAEKIHVQEARQQEALLNYRQTILQALREVEDGLVNYAKAQERTKSLRDAVAANERAVRIANDLYSQGLQDFVSVLDAERDLFQTEDDLAMSQGQVDTTLVALYKSLGGGWEIDAIREVTGEKATPVKTTDF